MTSNLVGDVYQKIMQDVVDSSRNDFEESGVAQSTLDELKEEWQKKLSARGVAIMPWDPKPAPAMVPQQQTQPQQQAASNPMPAPPSAVANGLPQHGYAYDPQAHGVNGARIKTEPGVEMQYNGLPNGYPPSAGGGARAQQLLQQQYGQAANASVNAMQRGGLALPGQQARPQGLQLPAQNPQQLQAQYAAQQQQQQARLHQQQLQQQSQPRVKVENDSPKVDQGTFQQGRPNGAPYPTQTDGADDGLGEWQAMLAGRRALHHKHGDRIMRMQVEQLRSEFDNGLMLPMGDGPQRSKDKPRMTAQAPSRASSSVVSVPQLDGDVDDDDEKPDIKDEDDENAINSDLDDSDEDNQENMGEDDDEMGDSILCTYDKVQRVKNKWKCTLKDGVMSIRSKEWVFHKGTGEFEW